jgi:hypothetical protein
MGKKKRTPRIGQVLQVGPFKTLEEVDREANRKLAELKGINIVSAQPISTPAGNILVITYKLSRKQAKALRSAVEPLTNPAGTEPACNCPKPIS